MKINELMIGDWIQVKRGFDGHLTNEKIKGLIDNDTELYPITLATEETVSLNDIVPIELTEDILVKNGFHTYGESYFIPEDKCNAYVRIGFHKRETVVDLHRHGAFSIQISCKPGKLYIHQLQRLLNLCNIDKEIIL